MSALKGLPGEQGDLNYTREKFRLRGGVSLRGVVEVNGGKNAALAMLPAALLCDEPVTIENLPMIDDVEHMRELLEAVGARVRVTGRSMTIDSSHLRPGVMPDCPAAGQIRASYYVLGAMLGRFGDGRVPLPGGCQIGSRAIDQHFKGFEALGAHMTEKDGGLVVRAVDLKCNEVYLDVPSVGATINVMLAAARIPGHTTIVNAGKEPQIVDVANFLNAMGASIRGAGTESIRIKGVSYLHGCSYAIIPDQIETGTLMIAAAATCGDVTIKGAIPTHMESLSAKLLEMGARVEEGVGEDSIRVWSSGNHRHVNIKTLPYPGFQTDWQQPISALLSTARGISTIHETIYEMRFRHLEQIKRLGGKSRVHDRFAVIEGVPSLKGGEVTAGDLRAGAALVIAGLMAEGVTWVDNIHYIDRGYEQLERKLRSLGAHIDRVPVS